MISVELERALTLIAIEGHDESESYVLPNRENLQKMANHLMDQDIDDPIEATKDMIDKANELGLEDYELLMIVLSGMGVEDEED